MNMMTYFAKGQVTAVNAVEFGLNVPFVNRATNEHTLVWVRGHFAGEGIEAHEEDGVRHVIGQALIRSAQAYEGDIQQLTSKREEWAQWVQHQVAPALRQHFEASGMLAISEVRLGGGQAAQPVKAASGTMAGLGSLGDTLAGADPMGQAPSHMQQMPPSASQPKAPMPTSPTPASSPAGGMMHDAKAKLGEIADSVAGAISSPAMPVVAVGAAAVGALGAAAAGALGARALGALGNDATGGGAVHPGAVHPGAVHPGAVHPGAGHSSEMRSNAQAPKVAGSTVMPSLVQALMQQVGLAPLQAQKAADLAASMLLGQPVHGDSTSMYGAPRTDSPMTNQTKKSVDASPEHAPAYGQKTPAYGASPATNKKDLYAPKKADPFAQTYAQTPEAPPAKKKPSYGSPAKPPPAYSEPYKGYDPKKGTKK